MSSGGKSVGEGAYSCIFSPPLMCKDKPKQITNPSDDLTYSKLITTKYANIEFLISKKISKIPLWKNYFVISESICSPDKQTDKNINKCDVLDNHKLSDFKILKMPFGGMPFNRYTFHLESFDFMTFVKHLIEAGCLLNLFGIVHRDIHKGNILIDNDVPRIIDFNLSILVEDIKENKTVPLHSYSVESSQEPPDSTIVNGVSLGYKSDKIIESIILKNLIITRIVNILDVSREDMLKSIQLFYYKNKDSKASNNTEWFKNYWRTIDSWAIGANILSLINDFSLSPTFSNTINIHKNKLFPMLKKLCAVSPNERIDCIQALNYLDPNNFIIKKYAKSWLNVVGNGNII